MKRAALYARVSTANQENEQTIENQLMVVEERIKKDNNVLVDACIYKDNGWSGGVLARPSLDKMREDARKGLFDVLYVYDRGRLARDLVFQEIVIGDLKDDDVEFVTVQDSSDPFLQKFEGLFYEYERAKIYERFRFGKIRKTKDGTLLGYNPLYGYSYVAKTKEKNGFFVINEEEAEVVRMIFHWVAYEGYSTLKVVKRLHDEGILPRKRKRDVWTKGPVGRMLRDSSYIGEHYYLKTEAIISKNPRTTAKYHKVKKSGRRMRPIEDRIKIEIPAIIDKKTFKKVQKQLALNAKFASRNKKGNYLLSGLVYCSCGRKRVGEKSADHLYYRCSDRIYSYPLPPECREKGVNAKIIDTLAFDKIKELFSNEGLLRKQVERWLLNKKPNNTPTTTDSEKTRSELNKIELEQERYLKAYGTGGTSFEAYEKLMKDVTMRKTRLQKLLIELESCIIRAEDTPNENIDTVCLKASETVKKLNSEDKQAFARKVIDKIVTNQTEAIVKGYLPLYFGDKNDSFRLKDSYLQDSINHNIETGIKNVSFKLKDRNSWIAQCWQINAV